VPGLAVPGATAVTCASVPAACPLPDCGHEGQSGGSWVSRVTRSAPAAPPRRWSVASRLTRARGGRRRRPADLGNRPIDEPYCVDQYAAQRQLGTPKIWDGVEPMGFDCQVWPWKRCTPKAATCPTWTPTCAWERTPAPRLTSMSPLWPKCRSLSAGEETCSSTVLRSPTWRSISVTTESSKTSGRWPHRVALRRRVAGASSGRPAVPRPARLTPAPTRAHHHRAAAALSSPTSSRLSAHTVSRLNHVRDTARKPNQR